MNDKKNREVEQGLFKGHLDEKLIEKDLPSTDVYHSSECEEHDTGVKIPTEDAVEESIKWNEENKR